MKRIKLTLQPVSAFATPPLGDTLLGQMCWLIAFAYGEAKLRQLLEGYTQGAPFLVLSDFMPSGYVPRPTLPTSMEKLSHEQNNASARKQIKKLKWVSIEKTDEPIETWVQYAVDVPLGGWYQQYRNTINRLTGTTGTGQFAPYGVRQFWYGRAEQETSGAKILSTPKLDCYADIDESRMAVSEFIALFTAMGQEGFGKDASVGAGRFKVIEHTVADAPKPAGRYVLTLANCVPCGLAANPQHSFYKLFVRFGRHGGLDVLSGKPFKAPILMAERGAVFCLNTPAQASFIGRGVGGQGQLSNARPETVHQGYAPVIGVTCNHGGEE